VVDILSQVAIEKTCKIDTNIILRNRELKASRQGQRGKRKAKAENVSRFSIGYNGIIKIQKSDLNHTHTDLYSVLCHHMPRVLLQVG